MQGSFQSRYESGMDVYLQQSCFWKQNVQRLWTCPCTFAKQASQNNLKRLCSLLLCFLFTKKKAQKQVQRYPLCGENHTSLWHSLSCTHSVVSAEWKSVWLFCKTRTLFHKIIIWYFFYFWIEFVKIKHKKYYFLQKKIREKINFKLCNIKKQL